MIVLCYVAGYIPHEKPVHMFVKPASYAVAVGHEPVFGPVDRCDKFGFDPGLLANLAKSGFFLGLSVVDHAFWKLPPMFGMSKDDRDLDRSVNFTVSDAARRDLFERYGFFAGVFHRSLFTACSTAWSNSALIWSLNPVIFFTSFPCRSNTAV